MTYLCGRCLADTLDSSARVLAAEAAAADGAEDQLAQGVAGPDLIRTGPVLGVEDAHVLARKAFGCSLFARNGLGGNLVGNTHGVAQGQNGKGSESLGEAHLDDGR